MLYGSESDVEDSEVEEEAKPGNGVSNRKTGKVQTRGKSQFSAGTRLRMDDDEPMDLLEGATGNFLSECFSWHSIHVTNSASISLGP